MFMAQPRHREDGHGSIFYEPTRPNSSTVRPYQTQQKVKNSTQPDPTEPNQSNS